MKFCVIGLGRFGFHVATVLAENGMEVMAIDSNESIVASIRDLVTQAICMNITDESSLRSLGVEEMDTVVVAMGENFAQSILVTALLKKRMHVARVIARAISGIHKEILQLTGADQVILPEKEVGIRLADTLSHSFDEVVRVTRTFSISQLIAPSFLIGLTLTDPTWYKKYQVQCLGVKTDEKTILTDPSYSIAPGDTLLLAGDNKALERIARL
jgi:trk system potassium uptake protein TrkA